MIILTHEVHFVFIILVAKLVNTNKISPFYFISPAHNMINYNLGLKNHFIQLHFCLHHFKCMNLLMNGTFVHVLNSAKFYNVIA